MISDKKLGPISLRLRGIRANKSKKTTPYAAILAICNDMNWHYRFNPMRHQDGNRTI